MATELIEKRTRNSKTHSLGGRKYAWDGTIGSIHYWEDGWKEIDNVFESAQAPWDWQMLKAGYHIRVKEDFTAWQIIEFEKQGETIQFQPMALEWTNDLDQIQPIAMPHEVAPVITNPEVDLLPAVGMPSHQGTIRWNDGYGEGLDFEWRCTSTRLVKILEIENFNKLSTPEQWIIDGGNPVLRLNLIFDPSNVDIYVDGEIWDKKVKKQTFNVIEFRKDGEVLWGFMPLRYWGSGEGENNEGQSVATLKKRGNSLYISIRVPYEWLQTAVYPVLVDTDVDEVVEASSDDCGTTEEWIGLINAYHGIDRDDRTYNFYTRFLTVDIAKDSTIDHAYPDLCAQNTEAGGSSLRIVGIDEPDTNTFSTQVDADGRAMTTAHVDWALGGIIAGQWYGRTNDPQDIKDVIEEIVGQADWVANHALAIKVYNLVWGAYKRIYTWDYNDHSLAPKLHIEYTPPAAAAGSSMVAKMMAAGVL